MPAAVLRSACAGGFVAVAGRSAAVSLGPVFEQPTLRNEKANPTATAKPALIENFIGPPLRTECCKSHTISGTPLPTLRPRAGSGRREILTSIGLVPSCT